MACMTPPKSKRTKGAAIADVEAALIKHIRAANGLSRVELARALGLSPSTAGVYVERLIRAGYLLEGKKTVAGAGRPRTRIVLNPEAGHFVGVDFHADEILAVAVDFAQNRSKDVTLPVKSKATARDVVCGTMRAIETVAPRNRKALLGIGIGAPGPVDRQRGVAMEYRYIRGFRDVPIVAPVAAQFPVPIHIENAANAMALAELWFGQGRGLRNLVCIWVRSGIGAGVIMDRRLYTGQDDGAGEIGFWRCPVYTTTSRGGLRVKERVGLRELEEIASVRAIRNALQDAVRKGEGSVLSRGSKGRRSDGIRDAYHGGDPLTRRVVTAAAGSLGWAVAHLCFCLAPERIILAGPLAELGHDFVEPIREAAAQCFAGSGMRPPEIALSTLGPLSGALGAAALCLDQWKPERPFSERPHSSAKARHCNSD